MASQASSPKDHPSSSPETFSPLGSGLSITAGAIQPPATDASEQLPASAPADAAAPQAGAEEDANEPEPARSAGPQRMHGEGVNLAARLACEAALKARSKAADNATAAGERSENKFAEPSLLPVAAAAEVEGLDALAQIAQGPLVMTVGAAEPVHKKKGLRSPAAARGSHTRPEPADDGTAAGASKAQANALPHALGPSIAASPLKPKSASEQPALAAAAEKESEAAETADECFTPSQDHDSETASHVADCAPEAGPTEAEVLAKLTPKALPSGMLASCQWLDNLLLLLQPNSRPMLLQIDDCPYFCDIHSCENVNFMSQAMQPPLPARLRARQPHQHTWISLKHERPLPSAAPAGSSPLRC